MIVIGTRVTYSPKGIQRLNPADPNRQGTVTAIGQSFPNLITVLWDGRKSDDYPFDPSFLKELK